MAFFIYFFSPLTFLSHKFLGETLGKSLFGVVYRGLNSNSGEFVAIKQIPLDDLDPDKVIFSPNLGWLRILPLIFFPSLPGGQHHQGGPGVHLAGPPEHCQGGRRHHQGQVPLPRP